MSIGKKIVAIASSTGGPKALQSFIPLLPANLDAPVVLVQHMPEGFTSVLSKNLNEVSQIEVSEAQNGEILTQGHVFLAPGGHHMKVERVGKQHRIKLTDEPPREGVRPSANYMFESLIDSFFDEIICVVLTGMGADGTVGIKNLKEYKKVEVFAQDEESSVVYGMPKAVVKAGLAAEASSLESIAKKITESVGVFNNGC